jgi:hypothetical protein
MLGAISEATKPFEAVGGTYNVQTLRQQVEQQRLFLSRPHSSNYFDR